MKCLIRADASVYIGTGHIMRCLTIASELKQKGLDVIFWMEELEGNLITFVKSMGYDVVDKPMLVDLLIVDHYGLDAKWELSMRSYCKKLIVIDDLANRPHSCDLIIDQNLVEGYLTRYEQLIPSNSIKLLGPQYLIMRQEFIEARRRLKVRSGKVNRLLIFMGGTDPTCETIKLLRAAQQSQVQFAHVDVVVGSSNPNIDEILELCSQLGYYFHCQINYIAELMLQADFSIGAGGTTIWERCYVGLPTAVTVVADNQLESTKMATLMNAILYIGKHDEVTIETYKSLFQLLPYLDDKLKKISDNCINITENHGVVNPWIYEMVGLLND